MTKVKVPTAFSASEMTYIVSSGALNSTHSLTPTAFTSSVSLHYLVKCQCFRRNNENKTTSVTTHLKSATSSSKADTLNI